MKKLYYVFYTFAFSLFPLVNSSAQCNVQLSASDSLVCSGDSVTFTASVPGNPLSLNATMVAGNNHRGNMFDIHALNTVTIESFDAHPMGNTTIEIYYRPTPFAGHENSSSGWTLLGSASVTAQPYGTPTPVPVAVNVTIPAGQTYGFYVTSSNTGISLNYTDGNSQGAVFTSDANIQFLQGVGMEYPFTNGGGVFTPRVWNGIIHYSTPASVAFQWNTGETTASIVREINSTQQVSVAATISGCGTTETDSFTVTVSQPPVNAGADRDVCAGAEVTLSAGGAASYSWNNGVSDGVPFVPAASGAYIVTGTDSIGCTADDTLQLNLITVDNGISVNDFTIVANASGASYTWLDCISGMPVAGAAGQAYTVTANGSYAVIVTQAGCTDTSACHQVFTIGVEEAENGGDIVFYPNPSDGQLFVQSSGIIEQIGLLAINGQLLYTLRPAANYAVLNLETYPAGVYLLRIETGGKTVFRKIIRR